MDEKIFKSPGKKTREIKFIFREIAFLTVFKTFSHFWPFLKLQKINLVKNFFHEIDLFGSTSFFAWTF